MELLSSLAKGIDRINKIIGKIFSWMVLLMTLLTFAIVVMRYGFDYGKIWIQEIVLYMHGMFFMALAAYTLSQNGHVRVDVFYGTRPKKYKRWVDLLGNVLLLFPTCILVIFYSVEYVAASWSVFETSGQPGGLPLVFALKSFLLVFGFTLILQSFAQFFKTLTEFADGGCHD